MIADWIKQHPKGTSLSLYVRPGASRTCISGEHDGKLKIKIKAHPVDGEANENLIEFLSEVLKISKAKIHLLSGESSRQKLVLVELSLQETMTLLSS